MVNTRTVFLLLSLIFLLEIGTTLSRSLNDQESSKIESQSSGDNSIPDELSNNDDDLASDAGSGDFYSKEKQKPFAQSIEFNDKQVDKLIQAEDFGKGEDEGSGLNSIPELKEANDGSGEVIEMEKPKNKFVQDKGLGSIESFGKPQSTLQTSFPSQEGEPTIITGGQQGAQVYGVQSNTPTTTQTQTYNYATGPSATDNTQQSTVVSQTNTQTYTPQTTSYDTDTTTSNQYYNDAAPQAAQPVAQPTQSVAQPASQNIAQPVAQAVAQPTQGVAQTYNDATQQSAPNAAQYYNDEAPQQPSQVAQAAQPAQQAKQAPEQNVQSYAPQNDAMPQAVDAAIEATHPGAQTANYVPNLASQPSDVINNAVQSVDAATLQNPQQQYYNTPAEQTTPQPGNSDYLTSSFMGNAAGQQEGAQPVQYNSNDEQTIQAYAPTPQYQDASTSGVELRKQYSLDENKFRTVICQNNQDTIVCPEGKKINITDAHYGSMGYSSCQGNENANFLPMQPCETPNAYKIVKTGCNDMENCMLSANDGIFGDQCQSDKKYLDVNYSCVEKEPAQPNQNMYPGYQANQYAYPQQQEQQQQQQNDEPKFSPPPPPKIPELMSTLVQLSKNKKKYGYLDGGDSCSSCKTCNQCYKSPKCASCSLCQSKLCDEAQASLPMIPKDVRPLWEQWSERTADMNSMEMSGLIFESPKKWLKKLGIKTGGSKRSHINSSKKADKKTHKKAATKKQ